MYMRITMAGRGRVTPCFDQKNKKDNKNNQKNIKSRSAEAKNLSGAGFFNGISGQQHVEDRPRENAEQGVSPPHLQDDHAC